MKNTSSFILSESILCLSVKFVNVKVLTSEGAQLGLAGAIVEVSTWRHNFAVNCELTQVFRLPRSFPFQYL